MHIYYDHDMYERLEKLAEENSKEPFLHHLETKAFKICFCFIETKIKLETVCVNLSSV